MRRPTICICKNKGADQLRHYCKGDLCLCFCYKDSTVPLLSKFQASSYTARFESNLFGNHIVGFLMRRLICKWLNANFIQESENRRANVFASKINMIKEYIHEVSTVLVCIALLTTPY